MREIGVLLKEESGIATIVGFGFDINYEIMMCGDYDIIRMIPINGLFPIDEIKEIIHKYSMQIFKNDPTLITLVQKRLVILENNADLLVLAIARKPQYPIHIIFKVMD